jgi:hypothetical protein
LEATHQQRNIPTTKVLSISFGVIPHGLEDELLSYTCLWPTKTPVNIDSHTESNTKENRYFTHLEIGKCLAHKEILSHDAGSIIFVDRGFGEQMNGMISLDDSMNRVEESFGCGIQGFERCIRSDSFSDELQDRHGRIVPVGDFQ